MIGKDRTSVPVGSPISFAAPSNPFGKIGGEEQKSNRKFIPPRQKPRLRFRLGGIL